MVREGNLCKPHSTWDVALSQFEIVSYVKLEGRSCIRNTNFGQSFMTSD